MKLVTQIPQNLAMGFVLEQAYWVYVRNSYLERKVWFGLVWS